MKSTIFERSFGLDLLRVIAICLVLMSHVTLLIFPNNENIILTVIRVLGAVGVDLFFVLSGFLIGGILLKQIDLKQTAFKDLLVFWKRRWLRTLPNYYLILGINIVIYLFLNRELPIQLWLFFPFLQNLNYPQINFFTEAWSLSIEEYAYLLLPFIFYSCFLIFKSFEKKKLFFLVTVTFISVLAILKVNYFFNNNVNSYFDWSSSFRKVVIYRLDSIYIGFLLVYFVKKFPDFFKAYKKHLFFFGAFIFMLLHLIIFIMQLLPQSNLGFYVFVYLQVIVISIALTFPFFIKLNYKGILSKPILLISKLSYSIYLINYSIILLNIQAIVDVDNFSSIEKCSLTFGFLSSTILLSFFLYKYFELPILKYRDRIYK